MLVVANAIRCLQARGEQGGYIGGEVDRLFPGKTLSGCSCPIIVWVVRQPTGSFEDPDGLALGFDQERTRQMRSEVEGNLVAAIVMDFDQQMPFVFNVGVQLSIRTGEQSAVGIQPF